MDKRRRMYVPTPYEKLRAEYRVGHELRALNRSEANKNGCYDCADALDVSGNPSYERESENCCFCPHKWCIYGGM